MLHYLWIFITEFGTLILYAFLYAHLRNQVKMASRNGISTGALSRVAHAQRYMLLYPAIYLCLTLPLAIGRMITSAQGHGNETYLLVAGSLFCSCGIFDAFIYTLTRRVFASDGHSRGQDDTTNRSTCSTSARHTNDLSGNVCNNEDEQDTTRCLNSGVFMMRDLKEENSKRPAERRSRLCVRRSIPERALTTGVPTPTLLSSGSADTLDSIDPETKLDDDFDPDAKMALFILDGTSNPPSSDNSLSPLVPRTVTTPTTVHSTLRDRIFNSGRSHRHDANCHTVSRRGLPWADRSMRSG